MTKKQKQLMLEEIAYLNDEELEQETLRKLCEFLEVELNKKIVYLEFGSKYKKEQEKLLYEIASLYMEIAKKRGTDIFWRTSK